MARKSKERATDPTPDSAHKSEQLPLLEDITPEEFAYYQSFGRTEDGGSISDIYARRPLRIFDRLVEAAQRQEIPIQDVLDFINPRVDRSIQGHSFMDSIGHLIGDKIHRGVGPNDERRVAYKEKIKEFYLLIEERWFAMLAALGQPHPFIWSSHKDILVQQDLPAQKQTVPIGDLYRQVIVELYEYLETFGNRENIQRYYDIKLRLYKQIVRTGKFPDGRICDQDEATRLNQIIIDLEEVVEMLSNTSAGDS